MESGEGLFIDVSFQPDVTISLPAREVMPAPEAPAKALDIFTVLYEPELEGHPLMGYLGTGFLRKYRSVIDIPNRRLVLFPPAAPAANASRHRQVLHAHQWTNARSRALR